MLILVVLTNFWKKEPKMPVLCHLDNVGGKNPVLEHFGQVEHDFKLSFLHEKGDTKKVMYTPSCMLYSLTPPDVKGHA